MPMFNACAPCCTSDLDKNSPVILATETLGLGTIVLFGTGFIVNPICKFRPYNNSLFFDNIAIKTAGPFGCVGSKQLWFPCLPYADQCVTSCLPTVDFIQSSPGTINNLRGVWTGWNGYDNTTVLPNDYFDSVGNWVKSGGVLLLVANAPNDTSLHGITAIRQANGFLKHVGAKARFLEAFLRPLTGNLLVYIDFTYTYPSPATINDFYFTTDISRSGSLRPVGQTGYRATLNPDHWLVNGTLGNNLIDLGIYYGAPTAIVGGEWVAKSVA